MITLPFLATMATRKSLWPPPASTHFWRGDDMTVVGSDVTAFNDQVGSVDLSVFTTPGLATTLGAASPGVELVDLGGYQANFVGTPEVMTTGGVAMVIDMPQVDGGASIDKDIVCGVGSGTDILVQAVPALAGQCFFRCHRVNGETPLDASVASLGLMDLVFTWTPTARYLYVNGALVSSDATAGSALDIVRWRIGYRSGLQTYAPDEKVREVRPFQSLATLPMVQAFHAYRLVNCP